MRRFNWKKSKEGVPARAFPRKEPLLFSGALTRQRRCPVAQRSEGERNSSLGGGRVNRKTGKKVRGRILRILQRAPLVAASARGSRYRFRLSEVRQ